MYILCVCIVSSVCNALSLNNIFSRDRRLTIYVQLGRSLGINKPYKDNSTIDCVAVVATSTNLSGQL